MSEYKERQEDEVEFLQAVFFNPGDFQDLRKNDSWKVRRFPYAYMDVDRYSSSGKCTMYVIVG